MNNYQIKIIQGGQEISQGFGHGSSACEALENAIKSGLVYIPSSDESVIGLVLSDAGIVFKFELGVAF